MKRTNHTRPWCIFTNEPLPTTKEQITERTALNNTFLNNQNSIAKVISVSAEKTNVLTIFINVKKNTSDMQDKSEIEPLIENKNTP